MAFGDGGKVFFHFFISFLLIAMEICYEKYQDAEIFKSIPSKPDHTLLSVFDGHGGAGAAEYAMAHMCTILESTEEWRAYVAGGIENPGLIIELIFYI